MYLLKKKNNFDEFKFKSILAFEPILGLQPRDKAAMLGVNTIEILLEKFTWK